MERLLPLENLLACNRRFITEKWRVANQHLEENGTARPPVDCLVVALLTEDLGCNIVRGTDSGESELSMTDVLGSLVHLSTTHVRIPLRHSIALLLQVCQIVAHDLCQVLRFGLDFGVFAKTEVR